MYTLINALLLALLIPAVQNVAATTATAAPTCRAQVKGPELLTRIELAQGIIIEGPGQIVRRGQTVGEDSRVIVVAELDRLIRTDALTGEREEIPFDAPVQVAFEGRTNEEAVQKVGRIWCATVMSAQQSQAHHRGSAQQRPPTRVTAASVTRLALL